MALNGAGGSDGLSTRYMTSAVMSTGPSQRRRPKNLGSYYGNSRGAEGGGGRSYQGGYQPRRQGSGAAGDGIHNGGYHSRNAEYVEQNQAHSPTDSHGSSGRSGQVGLNMASAEGGYHQYQSKEFGRGSEYRQRGDNHHYNHHRHVPQQSAVQPLLDHVPNLQQTPPATGQTGVDIVNVSAQPSQDATAGAHFTPIPPPSQAAPLLTPFPGPAPTQIQAPPQTLGFYGYHPNSQPMLGSLALCHIPFGINPSSVISPMVYTQIIGSGMITPGLPYNITPCTIPNPFMQQPPTATHQVIIQHPQQGPQTFPQYHHHPFSHHPQFAMHSQQQAPVVHHHPTGGHQQASQPGTASASNAADDCVVFDSSSLLNPDADAFFPPAFPPTRPATEEESNSEQVTQLADDEVLVVDDEPDLETKRSDTNSEMQATSVIDDTGNDGGDEADDDENVKSTPSIENTN